MPKYGKHFKLNIILNLIAVITTKTNLATTEIVNLQHPRYDYIDVAKETASGRSKGQTTRIFTTGDDLDETFWLKYLGEEFRHAVHLQVDSDNNVVQIDSKHPQQLQHNKSFNLENKVEKRTRFVRQPTGDNKQIPVESLYKLDDKIYPTEKPENFNTNPTTSEHNNKDKYSHHQTENKKPLKNNKKKVIIHNKYKQKIIKVKPPSPLKAIHEPIVVNLPEIEESEHQINGEHEPVVVQMPPVIYHQKADLYTGKLPNLPSSNEKPNSLNEQNLASLNNQNANLYYEQIPKLSLNHQDQHHTHTYTSPTHLHSTNVHDTQQENQHIHQTDYTTATLNQIQQPYSYQTLPIALMSLSQLPVDSFAPRSSR
ncbi:hypothetical protein FF38_08593 [Lucilia cuprina]|uniref:Uncharacterized protein n=1 Tax=Lucilia cuprina TaxID=7375 RepID=A0A0L0C4U1_LUCCU|nr:hypothetical protein CVS40_2421 [Lucilia cuprina]KNC26459.1 hypothetical protein FF38_08593 [Lucilia cuprina]